MLVTNEEGLQIKTVNNEYIDVSPIPGCFIINIGDMLEKVTKGLFKSTVHRVVATGKERYSFPYFYDPGFDKKIHELDIKISEDEKKVIENTKKYKRIDALTIEELSTTLGDHYIAKHINSFPELA